MKTVMMETYSLEMVAVQGAMWNLDSYAINNLVAIFVDAILA
jgi:hypothetical protein